jgi:hypothetical protein
LVVPVILTVLPWSVCSDGSLASGVPAGIHPVNVWLGLVTEIEEGVPVLAHENGDDHAGNGDSLADEVWSIERINLGLIGRKKRAR